MPIRSFLATTLVACAATSALPTDARAHSVVPAPAPRVSVATSHPGPGYHARSTTGYARPGTRTIVNGQVVFVGGYTPATSLGEAPSRPMPDAPVLSDAERYRTATGGSLPPEHGLIALPATAPRGDVTYLWPTPTGN